VLTSASILAKLEGIIPWHLSKSDPRKVYDERHTEICVCVTPESAALIVTAVNRLRSESGPGAGASWQRKVLEADPSGADRATRTVQAKPDLATIHSEALGATTKDASFVVTGKRR
jgi:hypothetical protein